MLEYVHEPAYRRTIHHILSRGERRNSLARDVFHGQRGQLRKHYQAGQENQLDSLGIMINVIVLWQTVYTQAALDHLAASGYPLDPADVARLTPLGHPTINLDGQYRTTSRPPTTGLRPLRTDLLRILYRSSSQAGSVVTGTPGRRSVLGHVAGVSQDRRAGYFLKASLTFSPACLRLPLA